MTPASRILQSRLPLPVLLVAGAAIAVSRGQDAAWDLKNYHLYNAWAFLNGRLGTDLAAASIQSFFNPLLDIPYFWLGAGPLSEVPRILAALQGLWYGGVIFVLARISARLASQQARDIGFGDVFAVVIGATGTMTLTQAGLSTNELPLALLVLGGYLTAMPVVAGQEGGVARQRVAIAGFLCGVAAGLKPTAVVYAPSLGFAIWAALGFRVSGFRLMAVLGLASLAGFLTAYGMWGYALWSLTGNPVFPMFNQVFRSSWMPLTSGTDRQFMPDSLMQALFYPFWWLKKNATQGGNRFADWRYALAMLSVLTVFLTALVARTRPAIGPAGRMLIAFVSTSYVLWLLLYSILRYAVSIEALSGLTILVAVNAIAAAGRHRARTVALVMASVLVVVLATTRYTDWGHAPFSPVVFAVDAGSVEPNSLIVVLSAPTAYIVPFLENSASARVVSLTYLNVLGAGYGLDRRIRSAIRSHAGPRYALLRDFTEAEQAMLAEELPGYAMTHCRAVHSGIEQTRRRRDLSDGLRLCQIDVPELPGDDRRPEL